MNTRVTTILISGLLLLAGAGVRADDEVTFNRDIRPILSDTCFKCHGFDKNARKAELRLDTVEGAFTKRKKITPIVPGKIDESEVYHRIVTKNPDDLMPPPDSHLALTAGQIELIKRWINQGAKYEPHWSLIAPKAPAIPKVKGAAWVRNPIDALVLAKLEREGLSPSPEGSRESLIRRVTLDLTGVPPTPAEVAAFVVDRSPTAYEDLVDRLLKSPRYGERMAMDWLDLARYADSNGYEHDADRTMWPWRDWAVGAFNRNLPYDQFTIWQLAGDMLPDATREQRLATGFLRNHAINGEGGRIPEENRVEYIFDQIETVGSVWMGLTFNCSRCHDHKYDPLLRKDYYSFFAFFNQTPVNGEGGNPQTRPVIEAASPEQLARLDALDKRKGELKEKLDKRTAELQAKRPADAASLKPDKLAAEFRNSDEVYRKLADETDAVRGSMKALREGVVKVMVMEETAPLRKTYMLNKGLYTQREEEVTAAVPGSLPPLPAGAPANRLSLAKWLVSPQHPLTSRVTVNRFWAQFFGMGLVKTPEDFGTQGEAPRNPELLDWLATRFIADGWDVKALCKLIVTSATYRQSSRVTPQLLERDPENRLLARGPRFRLTSWMLRDQALAAGGLLVERVGGPPVKPYQPAGVWEEATFGTVKYQQDRGEALYRRSIYTFWRRIVAPTMFFDVAGRQVCAIKQPRTNTPLHALTTLNETTFVEASRAMAQRVLDAAGPKATDAARLEQAFALLTARRPADAEMQVLLESLGRARKQFAADPSGAAKLLMLGESKRDTRIDPVEHAAWASVCLVLMNLDETLTKE